MVQKGSLRVRSEYSYYDEVQIVITGTERSANRHRRPHASPTIRDNGRDPRQGARNTSAQTSKQSFTVAEGTIHFYSLIRYGPRCPRLTRTSLAANLAMGRQLPRSRRLLGPDDSFHASSGYDTRPATQSSPSVSHLRRAMAEAQVLEHLVRCSRFTQEPGVSGPAAVERDGQRVVFPVDWPGW